MGHLPFISTMAVIVQSRTRVFPESHGQSSQPKTEPLSILDATVLNFATSGCVLFYPDSLDKNRLLISLRKTLDAYPQWAGQLKFSKYNPHAGHKYRQGRLELFYDSASDPGIECIMADCGGPMPLMIPPASEGRTWDATKVEYQALLDMDTPFGLNEANDPTGVPSMKVQFTSFSTPGLAIAIGLLHPLADAQSLLHFAHSWASTNRALSSFSSLPKLGPTFNPSSLDLGAAGDIDALKPNPSIFEKSRKLPLHRYDYWASAATAPEWALPNCKIPAEVNVTVNSLEKGPPIPWETWKMEAPVSHVNYFFSAAEAHAIYLHVAAQTTARISHQDALLAHVWAALIRARGLEEGEEHFMDVSVDVRRRLNPSLPPSFIGSPIINAACPTTASRSITPLDLAKDVGRKAASIRNTVMKFDADNTASLLHEMAFELGAQRRWNCFLGDYHVIATSWIGIGLGDVVFEEGVRSLWVEALLPPCESMVQLKEGIGEVQPENGDKTGEKWSREWWRNGVTLSIWLREDIMERLIRDEHLRAFA